MSIFHGGDSGFVPLKGLKADVAFLPTGEPSPTASPTDALKMALDLNPKLVVTIHGSKAQNKQFQSLAGKELPEAKVYIPERWKPIKVKLWGSEKIILSPTPTFGASSYPIKLDFSCPCHHHSGS